jgi:cell division septation protein DedD
VTFPSDSLQRDSLSASSTATRAGGASLPVPVVQDTSRLPAAPVAPPSGFTVSFAALLSEEKAREIASLIKVNGNAAHVVSTTTAGSPIFRVVMGPFPTRDEADKVGRAAKHEYWIYEGSP